jgi:hypothetical protein
MRYLASRLRRDNPAHWHEATVVDENGEPIEIHITPVWQGYDEIVNNKPTGKIVIGWYIDEHGEIVNRYLQEEDPGGRYWYTDEKGEIVIKYPGSISTLNPSPTEQLKSALRISQQQGLIRPTGDPSLDAPITEQENDKENKKEDPNN